MQNIGRLPIIADTTRSLFIDRDIFGSDALAEANGATGFYVIESCPVRGYPQDISGPHGTREEAQAALDAIMGEAA